jgi:hypothetical protein
MIALLSSLTLGLAIHSGQPADCRQADETMLALSFQDFDQGDEGWRSLETAGCEIAAADGIKKYRERNADMVVNADNTLAWHEAQLRASAGQTDAALELMVSRRDTASPSIRPYTDATIAFLRRDWAGLLAARDALVALPEPQAFRDAANRYAASYPDLPPLKWPLNLDVVDGLIACFDRPYSEAYECR